MKHIDPSIRANFENCDGISLSTLEPGTTLFVETRNSAYTIQIIEAKKIRFHGGKIDQPIEAIFVGSNWGGSMMKVDYLGKNMRMEIFLAKGTLGLESNGMFVSSPVVDLEVIAPDKSWSYHMEWKGT